MKMVVIDWTRYGALDAGATGSEEAGVLQEAKTERGGRGGSSMKEAEHRIWQCSNAKILQLRGGANGR